MGFMTINKIKNLLFFCCFVLSLDSDALIKLNVETLMKNYIDEGLILSSEFNSSKTLEEGVESSFNLGDKLRFKLIVQFENDTLNSGPSDLISMKGTLIYSSSLRDYKFDLGPRKFRLGQKESRYFI